MAKTKATTKKTAGKKPTVVAKKKIPSEKKPIEKKVETNDMEEGQYTGHLLTTEQVANIMKFDISRVSQLKKLGVITPYISRSKKEGDFYKPDVFIYIARYYRELSDSRGSKDSEEMKNARERQLMARAKKEEIELLEKEGELVDPKDVMRVMGAVLTRLRINLLSISKGVAPQLKDQTDETVIAGKIHERIVRALIEVSTLDINKLLSEME